MDCENAADCGGYTDSNSTIGSDVRFSSEEIMEGTGQNFVDTREQFQLSSAGEITNSPIEEFIDFAELEQIFMNKNVELEKFPLLDEESSPETYGQQGEYQSITLIEFVVELERQRRREWQLQILDLTEFLTNYGDENFTRQRREEWQLLVFDLTEFLANMWGENLSGLETGSVQVNDEVSDQSAPVSSIIAVVGHRENISQEEQTVGSPPVLYLKVDEPVCATNYGPICYSSEEILELGFRPSNQINFVIHDYH